MCIAITGVFQLVSIREQKTAAEHVLMKLLSKLSQCRINFTFDFLVMNRGVSRTGKLSPEASSIMNVMHTIRNSLMLCHHYVFVCLFF